jgi:hypothetical protein
MINQSQFEYALSRSRDIESIIFLLPLQVSSPVWFWRCCSALVTKAQHQQLFGGTSFNLSQHEVID